MAIRASSFSVLAGQERHHGSEKKSQMAYVRKLTVHSKFYFFDVGVYRAIRPRGPYDSVEKIEGDAFETLVYQELQAINHYFNFQYQLYFWRTVDQLEVDFVLYGPKGVIGIEVKRASTIDPKDLRGLKAFGEDYPEAKLFLFYGGTRREFIGNIQLIPLEEALPSLPDILN